MKFDRDVYRTISLITQFGINMIVTIFLCSFLGGFLDRKLGTNFLIIVGFAIGAVAGGYNVYRLSKRYMKKKHPDAPYLHGIKADEAVENEENSGKEDNQSGI